MQQVMQKFIKFQRKKTIIFLITIDVNFWEGRHGRIPYRNYACNSYDSDNSADGSQYVDAAVREITVGAADQLYIYPELGIFSQS